VFPLEAAFAPEGFTRIEHSAILMAMKVMWAAAVGVTALAVWLAAAAPPQATGWVRESPTPLTREEAAVTVNGVEEIWALRWKSAPKPECEPSDVSLTCPCTGFAYGEAGDLELVRMRERIVFDRLSLTGLGEGFGSQGPTAIVQRWEPDHDKDWKASERDDFAEVVKKRPTVQVMRFGDYDHDGDGTEFYFQTEAMPCGKSYGVMVGISKRNPRLHVFGTALVPDEPLYLLRAEWEALRRATGPIDVLDWECDDHASDVREMLHLNWTAEGIAGTRRKYECVDGKAGKLISEDPL
jgi:hypothetical protein